MLSGSRTARFLLNWLIDWLNTRRRHERLRGRQLSWYVRLPFRAVSGLKIQSSALPSLGLNGCCGPLRRTYYREARQRGVADKKDGPRNEPWGSVSLLMAASDSFPFPSVSVCLSVCRLLVPRRHDSRCLHVHHDRRVDAGHRGRRIWWNILVVFRFRLLSHRVKTVERHQSVHPSVHLLLMFMVVEDAQCSLVIPRRVICPPASFMTESWRHCTESPDTSDDTGSGILWRRECMGAGQFGAK